MAVAASIGRRHQSYTQAFPWKLFALGDTRIADATLIPMLTEFLRSPTCCLPDGLARSLHAKVHAEHSTEHDRVQNLLSLRQCFMGLGWALKLSIAPVERVHAQNSAFASSSKQTRWHSFAANMVCRERALFSSAVSARRNHRDNTADGQVDADTGADSGGHLFAVGVMLYCLLLVCPSERLTFLELVVQAIRYNCHVLCVGCAGCLPSILQACAGTSSEA